MSEKVQYIISEIEKIKAILIANNQLSNIEIDLVKSKLRKAYDLALNLNASSFEVQNADEELNKLIDDHENAIEVIIQKVETVAEDVKHEVIQESRIEVPEPIIDIQEEKVVPIIEQIVQKEPIKESQDKEILADRFHGKQKSLNDIISKYQTQKDLTSRLKDNPISNIKSAIGLNDKFLIINELFKGDSNAFNLLIDELNGQKDLDQAMSFINKNLEWDEKQEGFKKLLELVFRRFLVTENLK
ncbi:MAG: hypothetical protein A2W98_01075 [Bacteroidetes bacterium GWF2_33_38]|nr:MAG: hypothetical protein A2W98_01075 [Bacteroidetes bacterium GWF2_33_38]OFY74663.1 MAG: hypothetical protein A2265_01595 [Bacteroidetes bacterium RIFOXYA12_FULL_33_9]OFY91643.1 MAG: hypothetical protein A2236_09430 [Bacteroidetes bacterium RIFOXYA2_FULL_33_7]HBX50614.1 hypothetical protein [Bacteroidales bacterium]